MDLNLLGPEASWVMKSVIPVGAVIAKTLNPSESSDEYKELLDLKTRTDEIWRSNQRAISMATSAVGLQTYTLSFREHVDHPIASFLRLTLEYANPKKHKPSWFVQDYRSKCKIGTYAPADILRYIFERLVVICPVPMNTEQAENYARKRSYLHQVLRRLRVFGDPMPNVDDFLTEFSDVYENCDNKSVLERESMEVFKQNHATYAHAMKAFYSEVISRASSCGRWIHSTSCPMETLMITSSYSYSYSRAFATSLRKNLLLLVDIAAYCGPLIYEDQPADLEAYTNSIIDSINKISKHTFTWLRDSLKSAWPAIYHQIIREAIVKVTPSSGVVTESNLRLAIDSVLTKMADTGITGYDYQILIAKSADQEHVFIGQDHYCSVKEGVYGFDVQINRFLLNYSDEEQTERVFEKMLNMTYYTINLNDTIQSEMASLYDRDTLEDIVTQLRKKLPSDMLFNDHFHCFTALRQYSPHFWSSCPTLEHTFRSFHYANINATNQVFYLNKGSKTQKCEVYFFYFFI
ncbi:hypothetical protein M3Y94_00377700 [Aphelenchoides besseyi]|nr:hypothetical protein M3Y94_00377700 [Aphelenchoides besseyi]